MLPELKTTLKNSSLYTSLKRKIRRQLKNFGAGETNFGKKIRSRHLMFWNSGNVNIANKIVAPDSYNIHSWKEGKLWQRKLSNKYNSREFAKMHGCKIPALYWKGRDVKSIDFNSLPSHYVIRPTIGHSCKGVFVMSGCVNLLDKKIYSIADIVELLSIEKEKNPDVEFLVEEFVKSEKGEYQIPIDYKFYMFNGELAVIETIKRFGPASGEAAYYDENWKRVDNIARGKYKEGNTLPPPACLNEMIAQAKELSKSYEIFVRIDFYASDKGAIFGELTPTPGSAYCLTPASDKKFIEYWDQYCAGMI